MLQVGSCNFFVLDEDRFDELGCQLAPDVVTTLFVGSPTVGGGSWFVLGEIAVPAQCLGAAVS